MSRRSTRSISTILKQTKPSAASIVKRVKKEQVILAEEDIKRAQSLACLNMEPTSSSSEDIKALPDHPQNLQDAVNHLCMVDSRFHALFSRFIPKPWTEEGLSEPKNHFRSLVLGVISQQVSGAAARSIGRKFVALFLPQEQAGAATAIDVDLDPEVEDGPGSLKIKMEDEQVAMANTSAPANDSFSTSFFPTPEQIALSDVLYLKSAGLSLRKAEYVLGIAQAFLRSELTDDFFATANDETIKKRLVALRGLGPWSAEMFMMLSLKHWDILSPGDIGIQRGMSYFVGKDPKDKSLHNKNKAQKYMSEAEMLAATETWRPYRYVLRGSRERLEYSADH